MFGAGSLFSFAGNLMKKRVAVPEFKPVDAQQEQLQAIQGNFAALPEAQALASQVNAFSQDQLLTALRGAIPRFDELNQRGSDLVAEFAAPGIPKDLQALIQRKSAAKSAAGGYAGSQSATNLEARDLGLTGLQLTGQKLSAIESWIGFAKQNTVAPMMDITSQFLRPQEQIALAVSERDKQFNRDFVNSQVTAAQHWRTLMGNEFVEFGGALKGAGSGMMGGGMGGGGGSMMQAAGGGGGAGAAAGGTGGF